MIQQHNGREYELDTERWVKNNFFLRQ